MPPASNQEVVRKRKKTHKRKKKNSAQPGEDSSEGEGQLPTLPQNAGKFLQAASDGEQPLSQDSSQAKRRKERRNEIYKRRTLYSSVKGVDYSIEKRHWKQKTGVNQDLEAASQGVNPNKKKRNQKKKEKGSDTPNNREKSGQPGEDLSVGEGHWSTLSPDLAQFIKGGSQSQSHPSSQPLTATACEDIINSQQVCIEANSDADPSGTADDSWLDDLPIEFIQFLKSHDASSHRLSREEFEKRWQRLADEINKDKPAAKVAFDRASKKLNDLPMVSERDGVDHDMSPEAIASREAEVIKAVNDLLTLAESKEVPDIWLPFIDQYRDHLFGRALLTGLLEGPAMNLILDLLQVLASTRDVTETFDQFLHTAYVFIAGRPPEGWEKRPPADDKEKLNWMELFIAILEYFGFGRQNRIDDHEGYAVSWIKANKKGRAPPSQFSKHSRFLGKHLASGKVSTKFVVIDQRHAALCQAMESSALLLFKPESNISDGRPLASIFGSLSEKMGDTLPKLLVSVLFSRILHKTIPHYSTVTFENAVVTVFPKIYLTKMGFMEDEDIAKREQPAFQREKWSSSYPPFHVVVYEAVEKCLVTSPEGVLELRVLAYLLETDPRRFLLVTKELVEIYTQIVHNVLVYSKKYRTRAGVVTLRREDDPKTPRRPKAFDCRLIELIRIYHCDRDFTAMEVEDVLKLYPAAKEGFLIRRAQGKYMLTEFATENGYLTEEQCRAKLMELLKECLKTERYFTHNSAINYIRKVHPEFYKKNFTTLFVNLRESLGKLLKKGMAKGKLPWLALDPVTDRPAIYKSPNDNLRPIRRPVDRFTGEMIVEPIILAKDTFINEQVNSATMEAINASIRETYRHSPVQPETPSADLFRNWRRHGYLNYDDKTELHSLPTERVPFRERVKSSYSKAKAMRDRTLQ